ncbi:extracellular solute-binding protein [Cohnella soli]|uniref:Extracellular solute-binding protein n=1 Tax=Cohnella soli TaxID=425005 RepID=A0ABW0HUY7_9BACL
MTKRLSLLMVLTMAVVLVLSACGEGGKNGGDNAAATGSPTKDAASSAGSKDEPVNPLGKYDPPIEVSTVKIFQEVEKFYNNETANNSIWSQGELNELGIKIKLLWSVIGASPGGPGEQKMNVTIASNDLPDIFQVNGKQLQLLVESGQVEDLTEVIHKYASPKMKKALAINNGQPLDIASFDGKVMALPVPRGNEDAYMIWVRKDWLDRLGLPEPQTMDDVQKIAEAFTKQDPDNNSKNDTYGIGLTKDLYTGGIHDLAGLFEGYHAYVNKWVKDDAGKLVYGGIQPEAKAALGTIKKMFESGWIDPEFGVKDAAKVSEMLVSGKLGMFYGMHWVPFWPLPDSVKADPKADWQPYQIVSADDKPAVPSVSMAVDTNGASFYVVRKGFQHPEAVVKLANYTLEKFYGFDTGMYDKNFINVYNEDGTIMEGGFKRHPLAAVVFQSPTQNFDIYEGVKAALEGNQDALKDLNVKTNYDGIKAYQEKKDIANYSAMKWVGPTGSSFATLSSYKETTTDQYTGPVTPTMAQRKSTLDKLQLETYTKIIVGGATLDAFDKFVEDWKKLGGDAITQEVNDWLSTK